MTDRASDRKASPHTRGKPRFAFTEFDAGLDRSEITWLLLNTNRGSRPNSDDELLAKICRNVARAAPQARGSSGKPMRAPRELVQ